MEAVATNTWNGGTADPTAAWCSNTDTRAPNLADGTTTSRTTSDAIGAGYANTQRMLRGCTFGAANLVAAYSGGGKSNWHLPSKDELTEFYAQRSILGGYANATSPFTVTSYWSSSEIDASNARALEDNGSSGASSKFETRRVRPVRAFG